MNKEQLNIDKSFREKLVNHSVEPPSHVWNGIQGEMKTLRKKKMIAFYSRIAAAAIVILAFLAGWYFNEHSENEQPEMVQNETIPAQEKEDSAAEKDIFEEQLEKMDDKSVEEVKPLLAAHDEKQQQNNYTVTTPNSNDEKDPATKLFADVKRVSLQAIDKLEARVYSGKNLATATIQPAEKEEPLLSDAERKLIAENAVSYQKEEKELSGWKMGLNVSPGYSSFESNHSGTYAKNMTYQSTEGTANVGGGISVQYKTGKRWSVESGVYYAQNGQKSGNSRDLFALANSEADYALQPAVDRANFNTAVQVVDNQIAMNSTAGVIEFDKLPEGAVLAANPEEDAAFSNTLLTNGEFTQIFDFVEIPLYLRYLLVDSKVGIEVLGGVNAGLVVGNNAFIKNNNGTQNIGSTKDISTVNISGTIGVGVNYALGKRLSLAVEPRLNYFLNSINTNPAVEYKPYRIGVYTGLYYDF